MSLELEKEEIKGLSAQEVEKRQAAGLVNTVKEKNGKSYGEIVFSNLFTFFNLVWAVIAVLMFLLGSIENMTFLFVIIPNVLIAIIQECRAKHKVEKLSVTTNPKVTVLRDGAEVQIECEKIVMDDVMRIEIGGQIPADAVVVAGVAEANESMLTGESNAIKKEKGDTLLGGSFLVSGAVYAKVVHVGKDNYVHKIEHAAKSFKAPASDLCRDLNKLLRYIAVFMIPMTVVMAISNFYAAGGDAHTVIKSTSGSVIGMIPAGMYLLITVTLTLSVMTLSEKRTLVQDMYSIEMLARADVICLDKTGTITDGTMCVCDLLPLGGTKEDEIKQALALLEGAEETLNPTSRALVEAFGQDDSFPMLDRVPFSSSRKYSAATFEGVGTFALGAPHFVPCPVDTDTEAKIADFAKDGKRVLLLTKLEKIDGEGVPMALVAIADRIRPNAKETIQKFQEQGVLIKVISGDHAATVSSIACRVGIRDAEKYISCETLSDEELKAAAEENTVFGRVTPEQKVLLIKHLRSLGHTVAMTGDGVNDTLALKESNCAIAMADGSEMARKISQIVLLDSDFGTLPDVVREGRRCINNVRMSSTLFLMKTLLTLLLSVFAVAAGTLYPFEPRHTVPLETFVIGIAAVLLALEPNKRRIEGAFIKSVILQSIPNAVTLFMPVLTLLLCFRFGEFGSVELRNTLCMTAMTAAGFVNLCFLCIPYTKWRAVVVTLMGAALAALVPISVYLLGDMFSLRVVAGEALLLPVLFGSIAFSALFHAVYRLIFKRIKRKKELFIKNA